MLTTAVVSIAYWIGLPFWWEKSQVATIFLLIVGNWLLINVTFHYIMAVITPAGEPPEVNISQFYKNFAPNFTSSFFFTGYFFK